MVTVYSRVSQIEVELYGFTAKLYLISSSEGKESWSVNFPMPVLALDSVEFQKYMMFLDYVDFYLQELNA